MSDDSMYSSPNAYLDQTLSRARDKVVIGISERDKIRGSVRSLSGSLPLPEIPPWFLSSLWMGCVGLAAVQSDGP